MADILSSIASLFRDISAPNPTPPPETDALQKMVSDIYSDDSVHAAPKNFAMPFLWGCASRPQFGNGNTVSYIDAGKADITFSGDNATPDSPDAPAADAGTTDSATPDTPSAPDTPIDIPSQPAFCTPQVVAPAGCAITDIAAGETTSCATTQDGNLLCWGRINKQEAGSVVDIFSSPTPQKMDGFQNIVQGSIYLQHLCARDTSGDVWCMGQNIWGQLGDGTKQNNAQAPVKVLGLSNVMKVATGGFHSCAMDTAGDLYCWGQNFKGQVGLGEGAATSVTQAQKINFPQPATISTLTLGDFHSCAIQEAGATYCWGHNGVGQLGVPAADKIALSPQFVGKSGYRIAAGTDFTCTLDQTCGVSCAGEGTSGQLGNGDNQSKPTFTPIVSLKSMSALSAGGQHACAITRSGELYCWGGGTATPAVVTGIAPVVQVAVGGHHTCILDNGCAVYCWGNNLHGQLGNGTTTDSEMPVKVGGLQ